MKEKDANLLISKKLREALQKRGADVVLTRSGSEHLPLYDRPIVAKLEDADLFISVHNNALPDGVNPWESHGVSTYYYHPFSKDLSEYVQSSMLNNLDMENFGHFRANFAVIRPTQYPAILVECAFMMIPDHEAALKTGAFQTRVAEAIAEGVERWVDHALPDQRYLDARRELQRRDGTK
jgi:N-acetylmuramoyl-L-alanine amidase